MGAVSAANWTVNPGSSIQSAINNASTNDTILVKDNNGTAYTYNEVISINKKINLRGNSTFVTIQSNSGNPTITVTSSGSGSTIQGLTIKSIGATCVSLYGSNCLIYNNNILGTDANGICTYSSSHNIIEYNNITGYDADGIDSYYSSNTIYGNTVSGCQDGRESDGIYSCGSTDNIIGNNVINNDVGIYDSGSTDNINFNRILGNYYAGLASDVTALNATNNWWGTNNPDTNFGSHCIWVYSGSVNYNPWLILNTTITPTNTTFIVADVTHNNAGNDTSPQGHIPDNTPINFTTNLGNITSPAYTKNGKANTTLDREAVTSGTATVTTTLDNQSIQTNINIKPVFNVNNTKMYLTIQAAIDDAKSSDTIQVENGIYMENIVINKLLTLEPVSGGNVTIQAFNPSKAVITINSEGAGSTVKGFIIEGALIGVYLNETSNSNITENNFTNNCNGIYLSDSNGNKISKNIVINNTNNGITINRSNNNIIYGNVICNNKESGINIYDPSGNINDIHFNRIVGNGVYGIYVEEGTVNATNNWWGSNTPLISGTGPSDIFVEYGTTTYNTWLVLSITGSSISVTHDNSSVKTCLTYNNLGEDTSSMGNIPDNTPINFTTTLGNINNVFTSNGVALATLSNLTVGTVNVSATLDNQTVSMVKKVFNTIQSAIDDSTTQDGDIIAVEDGNYTENIVLNKKVALESVNTGKVTIQPADNTLPVITVNKNNTIIKGFNIKGAINSMGIYINSTNNYVLGNNITDNHFGIYLNSSLNSTIYGNSIINNYNGINAFNTTNTIIYKNSVLNNTQNGIYLDMSNNSSIYENTIENNLCNGIFFNNSLNSTVYGNNILNNTLDGIYINNSSVNINFNRIYGNGRYGLENQGNGTVDATNNWWGSNTDPSRISTDIYNNGGTVNSNPWLVMNVTSSCDYSNINGATHDYIITADLTHNSTGNNTSSKGSLPDRTIINFFTNLGSLNVTTSTSKGKTSNTLNTPSVGITNVSATLDNQTVTISVNVTNTSVLGIYNTKTGVGYTTIQDAINNFYSPSGGAITLADGTYTENVIVDTNVTITPATGANVTIKAANPSLPVFTIETNSSTIKGLDIESGLCGIDLYSVTNCNITGNNISNNNCGIYLDNSSNNNITGNTLSRNDYGIYLDTSNDNISKNTVSNSYYGIYIENSSSTISGNSITTNEIGIAGNSSKNTLNGNNVTNNLIGIYCTNSNDTITSNNLTNNGIGIANIDSNSTLTGNNVTGSLIQDMLEIDTTGVVMADIYYDCGPATLATVLQKYFNITASQDQLATYAGTNYTGTSMYGLVQAAQEKGLNAYGLKLSVNQLEPGNIVYLVRKGEGHFSVITNITISTVYLADSELGNINMTLSDFTAIYSGNTLIITNNTNNTQLNNGTILTTEEMQNIIGGAWVYDVPANYVGTLNGPETYIGVLKIGESIDFHGTKGSTLNIKVTPTTWEDTIAYLVQCSLTVYSNKDYTGTISYQATKNCTLLNAPLIDSYSFSFATPDLAEVSWIWTISYVPINEGESSIPSTAADIPEIMENLSKLSSEINSLNKDAWGLPGYIYDIFGNAGEKFGLNEGLYGETLDGEPVSLFDMIRLAK
jgi:parallel beta-helix repeat protein